MKKRQGKSAATIVPRPSIGNNVSAANNEALFDRKIDLITEGIAPYFASKLTGNTIHHNYFEKGFLCFHNTSL